MAQSTRGTLLTGQSAFGRMSVKGRRRVPRPAASTIPLMSSTAGSFTAVSAETEEHRDELPADLDITGYVGPYMFPDNARRRIPGVLYLVTAAACAAMWATRSPGPLVNDGFLLVAIALALVGVYHLIAGFPLKVRETHALAAAAEAVGFPIGHASAQLGWRGLVSRPTWRILLYSAEDPPTKRGLVLVDAVDGSSSTSSSRTTPKTGLSTRHLLLSYSAVFLTLSTRCWGSRS